MQQKVWDYMVSGIEHIGRFVLFDDVFIICRLVVVGKHHPVPVVVMSLINLLVPSRPLVAFSLMMEFSGCGWELAWLCLCK